MIPAVALVVLSGGQDSITCLGWALKNFASVRAVSFLYGQRHAVEIECAKAVCAERHIPHTIINLNTVLTENVASALTSQNFAVSEPHPQMRGVPASFVPGRNALFLALAHTVAQSVGIKHVVVGMCQTDYSGYPDCRDGFIKAFEAAMNIGYQQDIQIHRPLMWLSKASTFRLADEVGFLQTVLHKSHTCYEGDHTTWNEWGYGCGKCPACKLRAEGYAKFLTDGKII